MTKLLVSIVSIVLVLFTSCLTEVNDIRDSKTISDSIYVSEYTEEIIPNGIYKVEFCNEVLETIQIEYNGRLYSFIGLGIVGDSIEIKNEEIIKWVYNKY